jgi:hypothetical protein
MPSCNRTTAFLQAALLAALYAVAGSAAAAPASAASAAPASTDAVFRPIFTTPQGPLSAGTAFVARLEHCEEPVLLTAIHLFGPGGGLAQPMSADDVKHGVSQAELTGIGSNAKHMLFEVDSLTPENATPCCTSDRMVGVGDVAAFTAPARLKSIGLPLAPDIAIAGDRVTLLAPLVGATDAGLRHDAVVIGMRDGFLVYKFDEPNIQLRATSGAPVVDAAGRVVAINLSSGRMSKEDPTAMIGAGNPASAWRGAVEAGCQAAAPK